MNSKGELVEPAKELHYPALIQSVIGSSKPAAYWAVSWHMQTPLENLDAGSFVLVEYRSSSSSAEGEAASAVIAEARMPLDKEYIDSGKMSVPLETPVDQSKANSSAVEIAGSLQVEVKLARKALPVTLRMINKM